MPILVVQVWRRNLDYVKKKYFTGEYIQIYGTRLETLEMISCDQQLTSPSLTADTVVPVLHCQREHWG